MQIISHGFDAKPSFDFIQDLLAEDASEEHMLILFPAIVA